MTSLTWNDFGKVGWLNKQEAQLLLRNRASAMHFFVAKLLSIVIMTYSYVYYLRNLRPANLLRTQLINFSMQPQHMRMMHDPTKNPCEYLHKLFTARNYRVPELHDCCYSIGLSVFTFTQLFQKPRKDVQDEC